MSDDKAHSEISFPHQVSHAPEILTLKKMKYFLAVSGHGQVTKAARDICVSPAVITVAIRQLEDFLGVLLFERNRQGMRLTQDGRRFRNYCEKVLVLVDDAAWALKKYSHTSGKILVAASPAVHGYFLPPHLARFRRMFPAVELRLIELQRKKIERDIISGKLDVGVILVSNVRDVKRLSVLTLFSSQRTLWCNTQHRFAALESVTLSDIASECYIQLTIDEAEHNTKMFFAREKQTPNYFLFTKTVEAVRGYVAQGEGVTVLSEMLFRAWSLEGDRILSKPIVPAVSPMEIGVVWRKNAPLTAEKKAFVDFLVSNTHDA